MAASTITHESALLRMEPPYPTYEFFNNWPEHRIRSEPTSTERLFWSLDGPLETAIAVLDRPLSENPETCEPFFNRSTGEYHPVAALPVSKPRVSSIIVHVHNLEDWEQTWEDMHWKHSEPDGDFEGCEWGLLDEGGGDEGGGDEGAKGRDERDGNGDDLYLRPLRCCGMPRPRNKDVSIVVLPAKTDGPDGGFVTVLDYVTAVHPWLMGLRGDILGEMGTSDGQDDPLPGDTSLVIDTFSCSSVWVKTRAEWMDWMGRRSPGLVGRLSGYGGRGENV